MTVLIIDCKTGSVTIGEGFTADEASRRFWETLPQMFGGFA